MDYMKQEELITEEKIAENTKETTEPKIDELTEGNTEGKVGGKTEFRGKKLLGNVIGGAVFGIIAALSFLAVQEIGTQLGLSTYSRTNEAVYAPVPDADSEDTTTGTPVYMHTGNVSTMVVTDVTDVVEAVMPAVVSVTNSYTTQYYYWSGEEESSGSGIIIGTNEEELLIVTNNHVVEGYDNLEVTLFDNTVVTAQLKGKDAAMDLAVLAVNKADLSEETLQSIEVATIGDSDMLRIGEPVIAIGNALGYGQSVTTGVVSALNRQMNMDSIEGTFIQTDAAINPGNSGGALLNIAGEVIGINSSKIGGGAVEGMGYAIPISAAMPILEELMVQETRVRVPEERQAYLGISGANITPAEAAYYGYPDGVYVANIYEGTAADYSDLQRGDFIVSFDGETVGTIEELQDLLLYYEAGTTVEMEIMRNTVKGYQPYTIEVVLGNRNDINDN